MGRSPGDRLLYQLTHLPATLIGLLILMSVLIPLWYEEKTLNRAIVLRDMLCQKRTARDMERTMFFVMTEGGKIISI